MKRKRNLPFPILLLLFLIAGGGIYFLLFYRSYGEIVDILPLEDGTALFVRKGATKDEPFWLVKENPQEGIDWSIELPGFVWEGMAAPMLAFGGGAVAVNVKTAKFQDSIVVYDLSTGKHLWGGDKGERFAYPPMYNVSEGVVPTVIEGGDYCEKYCLSGREMRSGKVIWEMETDITHPRADAFVWEGYYFAGRHDMGLPFQAVRLKDGDTLRKFFAIDALPMQKVLLLHVVSGPGFQKTGSVSGGDHAIIRYDPFTTASDTLSFYTEKKASKYNLASGGIYKGQVNWIMERPGEPALMESSFPMITEQTLFMDISVGNIQNSKLDYPLLDALAAWSPLIGNQTRYVPLRIPYSNAPRLGADSTQAIDPNGELIMLDLQEMEVVWRNAEKVSLEGYEILRMGDRYYLNGRDGLIIAFDGDRSSLQQAIFVPGIPYLRPHHFSGNRIWVPFDQGWIVLDAQTLRVVMKSDKDFKPSDMTDEARVRFGIP